MKAAEAARKLLVKIDETEQHIKQAPQAFLLEDDEAIALARQIIDDQEDLARTADQFMEACDAGD